MAEDEQDMDYDEDYMDNIDNENMDMEDDNNLIGGKYEFLTLDEMDKERQKKIEEFIQYSNLPQSQAELVLMNNNWNIDVLMNDWYDKMQKIKENSGIAQTKTSQEKLDKYFKSIKSVKIFVLCAKQKLNLVIVFV